MVNIRTDFDGDKHDEILVTSPWGIGILKLAGSTLNAPMMAPNGTRFGGWLYSTADNTLGPAGDFDGDKRDEFLITSGWGIGILKMSGNTLSSPMMAPNGTRFGGWLYSTADNTLGPVGDFDGDGRDEFLITSGWGIGILKMSGSTLSSPMMAPNGTRFGGWLYSTAENTLGPVGDFDGDGRDEFLITSGWGIGILKMSGSTLSSPMMAPNGTQFGGWVINTADNALGPIGDFDGDGRDEILVTSPSGIGILKLSGNTLNTLIVAPNGTQFGGWVINTADNHFGPVGDFDGDGCDEIFVTSPWGVGILKLSGNTLNVPVMAANGTRFGGWVYDNNFLGPVGDFDGDGRDEVLITSGWGIGILKLSEGILNAPMMAPNGTRFGGWLLSTADNHFGIGDEYISADCVTRLLSSGSPGAKINIVVLGDGFAAGKDQKVYNKKVKDLLIDGVFRNDFFLEQKSAFNIYRVNLVSRNSGVGTKTYTNNECKILASIVTRNTALGIYYNGCWAHCWLEGGPSTDTLLKNALDKWVPDYDLVLIILNNSGFGGCGGGGVALLPLGVTWDTIAHEFGHALGNLADEYCAKDEAYTGSEPNSVNLTINTNKATLKWKNYLASSTPIPTGVGKCAGYTQGTKPNNWSDSQSVGLFEGGGYFTRGIYRPVINCRMRGNLPPYCPVCYAQMKSVTSKYMGTDKMENAGEQKEPSDGYVRLRIHMEEGKLSVTDVKEVPGPFIAQTDVNLGYNYEVLTDDKSISLGFLPDVGVRRSFANIDAPGFERREHITVLPSFDFFVRVPRSQISEKTLPRMTIAVHEVKRTPDRFSKEVPLIKQPGLMSTEVGRMDGIKMDKVPKEVSLKFEHILKENKEQK